MKVENLDRAKELQKDLQKVDEYIITVQNANRIDLKIGTNDGVGLSDTNNKPNTFARMVIEMNKTLFLKQLNEERDKVLKEIEEL